MCEKRESVGVREKRECRRVRRESGRELGEENS